MKANNGKSKLFMTELNSQLVRINSARDAKHLPDRMVKSEKELESIYQPSHRLAVYGSLAPGKENHAQVENIPGSWEGDLYIEGKLLDRGWAQRLGYPAFHWIPDGSKVSIMLFVSESLPAHWDRLDKFEGEEYSRILVPVFDSRGLFTVANLYAAR